jgi:hypothetical protein
MCQFLLCNTLRKRKLIIEALDKHEKHRENSHHNLKNLSPARPQKQEPLVTSSEKSGVECKSEHVDGDVDRVEPAAHPAAESWPENLEADSKAQAARTSERTTQGSTRYRDEPMPVSQIPKAGSLSTTSGESRRAIAGPITPARTPEDLATSASASPAASFAGATRSSGDNRTPGCDSMAFPRSQERPKHARRSTSSRARSASSGHWSSQLETERKLHPRPAARSPAINIKFTLREKNTESPRRH